ncbi:unnamed protein product [Clonostachys rhizophaga]|uniref:C6 transcription factor n=1 Tax=Clonostachys rhizophaga TaxID=160324 RepID=A0A9N9V9A8_9HYPO|nr:unnamed protein product [Clonostachys rhizophaga]
MPAQTRSSQGKAWSHTPTTLTLSWLALSLPLVVWDTVYVLGRPHTMEGGWLHWPLWVPYKLYGTIDHVYGWKAFNANSGFTSAQGFLNAVETSMYLVYLWNVLARGEAGTRAVRGRHGALTLVTGFSAAVMTLSKSGSVLGANEYYSGFDNIGHNSTRDLITLWVMPNVPWIILSAYMTYVMGSDIVDGLAGTAEHDKDE